MKMIKNFVASAKNMNAFFSYLHFVRFREVINVKKNY